MKQMMMACAAAAAALTLGPLARAQTAEKPTGAEVANVLHSLYGIRPSFDKCVASLGDGGFKSKECVREELAYQDDRLNRAYQSLMGKLSPDLQPKLKSAENIWHQYRDTYCAAEFDGMERPELDRLSCEMNETAKQAAFLQNRLFFQ